MIPILAAVCTAVRSRSGARRGAGGGRFRTAIRSLAMVGIVWAASVEGAAPRYDADALRALAKIPRMELSTGFSYSNERGFALGEESFDARWNRPLPEALREMEGRLKGDERDAELLLELASTALDMGDRERARERLERSQRYFQLRMRTAPEDGWLRTQYGTALRMGERWEEAERVHRAAVSAAPKDWRCWNGLGDFLGQRAAAALAPSNALEAVLSGKGRGAVASPEARMAARRDLEEAQRCMDRAVELGPEVVEAYADRYLVKWIRRSILRPLLEEGVAEGSPLTAALPDEEMLADQRRVAVLTPTNAFAIGMAVTFDVWVEMARGGEFDPSPGACWPGVSESRKTFVRDQLRRLERLAESESARIAGAASAGSATVRLVVMGDFAGAERDARRSLSRYPEGDAAWEVLATCLVTQERWEALTTACQERLRIKESTRLRMTLAKSYERRELWKEAAREVERAARTAPGDFFVRVAGVALELRLSEGREGAEAVLGRMARMKEGTFVQEPPELQSHFELLHGIAYGLAGDLSEARRHFRRLLASDPANPDYRKALEAAGPGG